MSEVNPVTTAICFFSGTGNSLAAARRLAENIGDCGILSIPDIMRRGQGVRANRIIVVFPVYMWGLPDIVRKFLEALDGRSCGELYAVGTNGGLAGDPVRMIRAIARSKGIPFASGFLVWMPENFVIRYPMFPDWLERWAIRSSERKLDGIAGKIRGRKKGIHERTLFPVNGILTALNKRMDEALFTKKTLRPKDFFRATEECSSCGLCAKLCPAGNIVIANGKPVWGDNCEVCVACIQWCPRRAIQAGKATEKRARYHHPAIDADDMARSGIQDDATTSTNRTLTRSR